jgi:flavodoxin
MKSLFLSLTAFGIALAAIADNPKKPNLIRAQSKKILVAYYSWSGNTRTLAQQIQTATGADLFEIKPVKDYPTDFDACTKQADKEIKSNFHPELMAMPTNIESYDIVFVGSPNWWGTIAPPVAAFLTKANLQGKTIVPFCTHGSGGIQHVLTDIVKLAPKSNALNGIGIAGDAINSAKPNVDKWLQELKLQ